MHHASAVQPNKSTLWHLQTELHQIRTNLTRNPKNANQLLYYFLPQFFSFRFQLAAKEQQEQDNKAQFSIRARESEHAYVPQKSKLN